MTRLTLHGYRYSAYAWIARFAFAAKGVGHDWREVDPFADSVPADYPALHPFGRVPALTHGDFALYETGAISRYVDEAFDGPALQPTAPRARARMAQAISVADAYAYPVLVRQVFSHGPFARRTGNGGDPQIYQNGLRAAPRILGALEALASDGAFLVGDDLTLADIHLAPMIAYFTDSESSDGAPAALMAEHERLAGWLGRIRAHAALTVSAPDLPKATQSTG